MLRLWSDLQNIKNYFTTPLKHTVIEVHNNNSPIKTLTNKHSYLKCTINWLTEQEMEIQQEMEFHYTDMGVK